MVDIKSFLGIVRDHITGKPYWDKLKQEMDVNKFDVKFSMSRYGITHYVAAYIIKSEDRKNDKVLYGVGIHLDHEPFGMLHTYTTTRPRSPVDADGWHQGIWSEVLGFISPTLGC